jgi:beta-lactamase superfamily II metal-dependent hydrolase
MKPFVTQTLVCLVGQRLRKAFSLPYFRLLWLLALSWALDAQQATFYLVDIGHGNVAFVVSPSGETMLLDCGPGYALNRITRFVDQHNIKKIDYLVVSHFEEDHMGAVVALSKKIPILNLVDHGESVTYGKSDEWWKGRRAPWARAGMGEQDNQRFDAYKQVRAAAHHIPVKPGDKVPIKGLDVTVVTAGGHELTRPLQGAGQPNPACSKVPKRAEDDAEDGQSVGVVIADGTFRFIYLGDLTWQSSTRLFCPDNKVGTVDAYLVTHHAQSMGNELGDYYAGLSCCSIAEVSALRPRAGLISMGKEGHRYGNSEAIETVKSQPGMDLWQTEKIAGGGEAGFNAPDDYISNIGGPPAEQIPFLKVTANPDGSFQVTNSRNGFSRDYPAHKR